MMCYLLYVPVGCCTRKEGVRKEKGLNICSSKNIGLVCGVSKHGL
jgi:hypothetical protein